MGRSEREIVANRRRFAANRIQQVAAREVTRADARVEARAAGASPKRGARRAVEALWPSRPPVCPKGAGPERSASDGI
jgi:hypothetical protein